MLIFVFPHAASRPHILGRVINVTEKEPGHARKDAKEVIQNGCDLKKKRLMRSFGWACLKQPDAPMLQSE